MNQDHDAIAQSVPEQELLVKQLVNVGHVHVNVTQTVIVTTEDKIQICLDKHLKKMERKREWITPFSLCIAIVTTLATTSFKKFILTAETWNALFVIAAIVTFVWLLWTLFLVRQSSKLEDVIQELKTNSIYNDTKS